MEAEQFCVHHGLEVRDECIVIDKHRIVEPETPFVSGRAINVIESKQHTCVGEVRYFIQGSDKLYILDKVRVANYS